MRLDQRHWRRTDDGFEFAMAVDLFGRWFRLGIFYGEPPGSRIGFWRTRCDELHGWNYRIGKQYTGPCLTALLHTRPSRPATLSGLLHG
jgi:hypothetical protein